MPRARDSGELAGGGRRPASDRAGDDPGLAPAPPPARAGIVGGRRRGAREADLARRRGRGGARLLGGDGRARRRGDGRGAGAALARLPPSSATVPVRPNTLQPATIVPATLSTMTISATWTAPIMKKAIAALRIDLPGRLRQRAQHRHRQLEHQRAAEHREQRRERQQHHALEPAGEQPARRLEQRQHHEHRAEREQDRQRDLAGRQDADGAEQQQRAAEPQQPGRREGRGRFGHRAVAEACDQRREDDVDLVGEDLRSRSRWCR